MARTTTVKCEPIGLVEIADYSRIHRQTLSKALQRTRQGTRRNPFPEPRGYVSGTPWWLWGDLEEFIAIEVANRRFRQDS